MEHIRQILQNIVKKSSDYVETRMRLMALKSSEKLSNVLSDLFSMIIMVIIFTFALLIASVGMAKWIGYAMGNDWAGFFIVSGFYLLLFIMVLIGKEKLIRAPLLNSIIKSFFRVEEKAEEKVEDVEEKLIDKLDGDESESVDDLHQLEKKHTYYYKNSLIASPADFRHGTDHGRLGFNFSRFFSLLKKSFKEWNAQDPFRQSATIAYYAIFSLPALLVIVISLAGLFFGREAVTGQLSSQISSMIGPETADQVESMVAEASIGDKPIIATIIALVVLIIGSTGVFVQLQKSLNIIWEVKTSPKAKLLALLKSRLLSFGLVLSIGFLLLISLVISSFLTFFGEWMKTQLPDIAAFLLQLLNFVISFGLIAILFALMFKFLPDAKISWRDVWLGAILTSALFSFGKLLLGLYFGKAEPASTYGAAGSVVLIMLWISYSCMILFFGTEFTRQNALANGRVPQPNENAEKDKERKEAQKSDHKSEG